MFESAIYNGVRDGHKISENIEEIISLDVRKWLPRTAKILFKTVTKLFTVLFSSNRAQLHGQQVFGNSLGCSKIFNEFGDNRSTDILTHMPIDDYKSSFTANIL